MTKRKQPATRIGKASKATRGVATASANEKARSARREATERHLGMPWSEWQTKKRGQWRDVMAALARFGYGAAYTPEAGDLYEIQKAAERITERMEQNWVSW